MRILLIICLLILPGGQVWADCGRVQSSADCIDGRSLVEMAERFRSPLGTIKRRLHTARNRLRDELLAQPA